MGDCFMAFWGASLQDANHARHVVLAGLEMHDAMQDLRPFFRVRYWPEIHIAVGVNSSATAVGYTESELWDWKYGIGKTCRLHGNG